MQQRQQEHRQQLSRKNQKAETIYTRGPDQHRTIGNSTGSTNLGGGPQNTQTGAVRVDQATSRSAGNKHNTGSSNNLAYNNTTVNSDSGSASGQQQPVQSMPPGVTGSNENKGNNDQTPRGIDTLPQYIWSATQAKKESEGLGTTKSSLIFSQMRCRVGFVHNLYRPSLTDDCTVDYGRVLVTQWEFYDELEPKLKLYHLNHGTALDEFPERKNLGYNYKNYSIRPENIEEYLRDKKGCKSVARGKWVTF